MKNLKSMLFLRKGKAKLEGVLRDWATWWVVLWNASQVHMYTECPGSH